MSEKISLDSSEIFLYFKIVNPQKWNIKIMNFIGFVAI